jgi:hypothetical protein
MGLVETRGLGQIVEGRRWRIAKADVDELAVPRGL